MVARGSIISSVLSSKPVVQPAGKLIPLSPLDRSMEGSNLRMVFYYDFPTKPTLEELRESISEMLNFYPIATGRLVEGSGGRWMVKLNDAGVRVVEAKARVSLKEWLERIDREKELGLVYWEEMAHKPYIWSTFYVQITKFEGGGLAIGLSCTHLLSDPICAANMIKAWADTMLRGEPISPPTFTPLPPRKHENRLKHRSRLIDHYKSAIQNSTPTPHAKQTTIAFRFTHDMVSKCISMAERSSPLDQLEPNTTPFEALTALFWTRLNKIKGDRNGFLDVSICLDMRKVLKLDEARFGNFMAYIGVQGVELTENKVSQAAAVIKEATSRVDMDEVMDLIEWLERETGEIKVPCMNASRVVCANLESVDLYSTVFQDNVSPIRVSCYVEPALGPGHIIVMPLPSGGDLFGRVVSITLSADEAEMLLEDSLIQQFGATILMGKKALGSSGQYHNNCDVM